MHADTSLPLRGHQKPLKPKEEQVQGFRVVFAPTGKSISSAPLLCSTWHLKGGISRCLLEGKPFGGPSGQARSRADLWPRRRHYRKHEDQAEEMPQQPEAGIPARQQTLRVGRAAASPVCTPLLPRLGLRQHFPVRDLGSGEAASCCVTMM